MKGGKSTVVPELRFPEFRDAEVWRSQPLRSLLDYERPDKYIVTNTDYQDSGTPVLTANKSFVLGYTSETVGVYVDTPVIVFDDFTTDRKYVDFPFKIKSSAIKILKGKRDDSLKLIFELMSGIKFDPKDHKRYYISEYQHLEIALPKPPEQQKISDCLTSLDEVIAAQGRKIEALKTYKRGLMQQLFPREGESVPPLRFPEFRDRSEWTSRRIGELLREVPRSIEMGDEVEYALVTVKRRYGGVVSRERLKGRAIKVKSQFVVRASDFLISKRQIVHNACGIVPPDLDGSIVSNEYSVLGPRNGCNIEFFNYFSRQPAVSASFLKSSVGIVIEKMLFKLGTWLKYEFRFPDTEEQKKIAGVLASIEKKIAAEAKGLEALKNHKNGLMQQLFPSPKAS